MKMASPMASPSGRTPEQASRCDLFRTEACGGNISLLEERWMVWVFIGIYGGGIRSIHGTGAPQALMARLPTGHMSQACGASCFLSTSPEASRVLLGPEKIQKLASCLDLPRY